MNRNLNDKFLKILYPFVVEGQSKTKKLNIRDIKTESTDLSLYETAQEIGTLISSPSIAVEVNENFELSND